MPRNKGLCQGSQTAKRKSCGAAAKVECEIRARADLTQRAGMPQARRVHPRFSPGGRGLSALLAAALALLVEQPRAGADSAAQAWVSASKAHIQGKDITGEFNALYEGTSDKQKDRALLSAEQKAALKRYDVLLVPGFLTGFYLQIGKFIERTIDKKDVLNYLREAHEALDELGVQTEQVFLNRQTFNTQASAAENAQRIVETIGASAATGRRVILISHSKGGNDVLAALLALQRQRKLHQVAGWVSVQAGFAGSPIADEIAGNEALRKGAKLFIEELGGTIQSLDDMTSPVCQKVLHDHRQEIRRLVKSLPIISFASWKPKPEDFQALHPDTILAQTRDLMASHGLNNDGLVPTASAVLPGSEYIAKLGVDHSEVAMANQPPVLASKLDRKRFLNVLLALILKRLPGAGQRPHQI